VYSLLVRFVDDDFDPTQATTIGVDFKTKKITVDDNTVKLAIWVIYLLRGDFHNVMSLGLYIRYV
jgi:hypothetical protein